jgi:hypothetical protein
MYETLQLQIAIVAELAKYRTETARHHSCLTFPEPKHYEQPDLGIYAILNVCSC